MQQLDFLPPEPKPVRVRDPDRHALWKDGLTAMQSLLGLRPDACRKLLGGRLCPAAKDDYVGLLALILEAVRARPDEPVSWLIAGARKLGCGEDQDAWGLGGWYAAAPQAVQDWPVEELAAVMEATGFPPSWRGSLDVLERLMDAGYRPDSVADVISQIVAGFEGTIRSLSFFDARVQRDALRLDRERMEYVRASRPR